ncbi:MAG: hypothetical protein ACRD7E_09240 [Bryobacteraceae bacterium]
MPSTNESRSSPEIPRELQSATPRPVHLNASGALVAFIALALLVASVLLPAVLYSHLVEEHRRAAELASEAVTTEAEGPPRPPPVGVVSFIPPVFVLTAGLLFALIRRRSRLLSEGRATLAKVTRAEKLRARESTTWRVHYEWTLLSGARRSYHRDFQQKTPPAPGTTIPIVYDRDNPRHHARYPLSLVRIPGAPGRGKARPGKRRQHQ